MKKRAYDKEIKEVIRQQQKIGVGLILWGFLAKEKSNEEIELIIVAILTG